MSTIRLIIVHLVLTIQFSFCGGDPSYSHVNYFSFASPNQLESLTAPSTNKINRLHTIEQADDNPFEEIDLPWIFPFCGFNIKSLFASPNGMLMTSKQLPFYIDYSTNVNGTIVYFEGSYSTGIQSLAKTYYGSINGLSTDLNPSAYSNASISYYIANDNSSVTINYKHIPLYNDTKNIEFSQFNSFRIVLFADGCISLHYDDIVDISKLSSPTYQFVSGIKDKLYPSPAASLVNYTAAQLGVGTSDWSTTMPGIYPRLADVVTGTQFTMCPVSSVWALSPASFDSSPGSSASALLTLTPLALSCAANVTYAIYLDGYSASPASCVYNSSGAVPTLTCDATGFRSQGLAAGDYAVKVQWTSVVASTPQSGTLNIPALTLSVSGGAAGTGCGLNTDIPGCDACTVAGGNLGCLQLPCGSVYPSSSCAGDCLFTNSTDRAGTCCAVSQQDCSGLCFGSAAVALSSLGGPLTCCAEHFYSSAVVDCLGVCGGSAKADCHGVCGGNATLDCTHTCGGTAAVDACGLCNGTGIECAMQVTIDSLDPQDPSAIYPVFSMRQLWKVFTIIVLNGHAVYDIAAFYSIVDRYPLDTYSANTGPDIQPSSNSVLIAASTSGGFDINISYAGLLSGVDQFWTVKQIKLIATFQQFVPGAVPFNATVSVYPTFTNCSLIKDRDTCLRLPACIFCLRYPSIRVLTSTEELVQQEPSNNVTRMLSADIVPPSSGFGIKMYKETKFGVCTNGWDTEADCAATILTLYSHALPTISIWSTIYGIIVGVALFIYLL